MRAVFEFTKVGAAAYMSHLDLVRALQRALRRVKAPVSYSQGFNPHMHVSFATALSLGVESRCELFEAKLLAPVSPDALKDALNQTLPQGVSIVSCVLWENEAPALTTFVKFASYEAHVTQSDAVQKIEALLASDSLLVQKKSKKGMKETNIRPMVRAMALEGETLRLTLTHAETGALKPELLFDAMGLAAQNIVRTALLNEVDGQLVPALKGGAA